MGLTMVRDGEGTDGLLVRAEAMGLGKIDGGR